MCWRCFIALAVTGLLTIGTRESATVNAVLVGIKLVALSAFMWLALPVMHMQNFHPFAPLGTPGHDRRGRFHLLCLCRLRCRLDRGRGNQESASATCPSG